MHVIGAIRNVALLALLFPGMAMASDEQVGRWSVLTHFGLSQMSDQRPDTVGLGATDGPADLAVEGGFVAGLTVERRITKQFSAQFGWEYRSNESPITLADGQQFPDGNYASNTFYLNGLFHFNQVRDFEPYLGAGLVWVQEIDIDLERNGVETSFDSQGDVGFALMAGVNYDLNNSWSINSEVRYTRVGGLDLGSVRDLEYNPVTLQLGLRYRF